jgi:hypothetical protein
MVASSGARNMPSSLLVQPSFNSVSSDGGDGSVKVLPEKVKSKRPDRTLLTAAATAGSGTYVGIHCRTGPGDLVGWGTVIDIRLIAALSGRGSVGTLTGRVHAGEG